MGAINFITCHDGFTLNDLVSYSRKHNEANGEDNRDGAAANFSQNYGCEGETTDAAINAVRKTQIKNFLLTLFISRGVPMLLGGDECRRTQAGNNNAYCQDNEMAWFDWSRVGEHHDIVRFTRGMSALRRAHPTLSREQFYSDAEIRWCAPSGGVPQWGHPMAKALACVIPEEERRAICLMFNAGSETVEFSVPAPAPGARWHVAADTSQEAPRESLCPR